VIPTHCFHCQETLPQENPQRFSAVINQDTRYFCCPACAAVASTIHNLGLEQYYRQRDNKPQRPAAQEIDAVDVEKYYQHALRTIDETWCEAQIFIPDIHCTSCCWLIEKCLQQVDGIAAVQAQFHSHKLTVRWKKNQALLPIILQELQHIGYRATPWQPSQQQKTTHTQQRHLLTRIGVAGLLGMQIHMVAMGAYFGAQANTQQWLNVVALLLSLPIWLYSADIFFNNAWKNIRNVIQRRQQRLTASMDLPIAIAIVAAAIASIIAVIKGTDDVYFDSITMFVFLLLSARFLETRARQRLAAFAQEPVLPQTCVRLQQGDDTVHQTIGIQQLQIGDCVWVDAGIIPVDGVVLRGTADVEQAIITGEFLPVKKQAQDRVLAGTTIIAGALVVRVEQWGENSHLAALHRRMETALSNKQQRKTHTFFYDTVAQFFTPTILALAIGSALFWWWMDTSKALPSFLAVLVASCPCALTLAIPAALTAATLQLRRRGILVTGAHVLPLLPNIAHYVFDKTGTLTQGKMHITAINISGDKSKADCLALACAMEHHATHPIASAFHHTTTNTLPLLDTAETVLHCGVEATIGDMLYRLGKPSWACFSDANRNNFPTISDDNLAIVLSENGKTLAIFSLGDPLRPTAQHCIAQLQNNGIQCAIVSGDNSAAVKNIAAHLSILDAYQNCTPEQKVQIIDSHHQKQHAVLMVGDGVNDGPVLAHADISVALAEASHTAQLAADVILLNNTLDDLLHLRRVALHTRRIARQNLAWALLYNFSVLPLAAAGWLTPVYAAIGMALSSLFVTLNALRLFPRSSAKEATAH
jgi:Cu2+-exporting ATPase